MKAVGEKEREGGRKWECERRMGVGVKGGGSFIASLAKVFKFNP